MSERLLGPDLSRGAMLLLIAMAYAAVYVGTPFGADVSALPLLDRVAATATTLLLDNRAFPMFAILFGYGLARSIDRRRERGIPEAETRRRTRRRGGYLLLFGAVHAILVFPGEILTSYGLAVLVLGGLLFRSNSAVRRAAVAFGAAYLVLVPLFATVMAAVGPQSAAVPGYTTPADWLERLFAPPFSLFYVALAYPLFLLVTLGILAGRRRLVDDPAAQRRLLAAIAAGGIAISVLGALPSALLSLGVGTSSVLGDGLLHGLQILTGVAGGAGYVALFALVSIPLSVRPGPVTRAVAAVGKRSLTFYLLNSVLVALILHPELIGLGATLGPFGALVVALLVWLGGLVLAGWMERTGQAGPLERLMGRLVDGPR